MKIKPLTGQVLVRLLPPDEMEGSLFVANGESNQENIYAKSRPRKGVIVGIGPWRKTKNGLGVLPPVKPRDTVLLSPYKGQNLTRDIADNMILINSDDILAVLTNGSEPIN